MVRPLVTLPTPSTPSPRSDCLVLTSTLEVANPGYLRPHGRHETRERIRDTVVALGAWATRQRSLRRVVLVDNSGYPLDEIRAVVDASAAAGMEIELLSFRTSGYSAERGRSFGELDIMREALARSRLLADSTHFVKCNARIFVRNVDRLVAATPDDFDVVGRLSHNLTWLATTFVMFRTAVFAKRILPYAAEHLNDLTCNYLERVYAKAVLHGIADDLRWYPFVCEPDLRGYRGLDGEPYDQGLLRRATTDLVIRGYHRAFDHSAGGAHEHPQARWARGGTPPGPTPPARDTD